MPGQEKSDWIRLRRCPVCLHRLVMLDVRAFPKLESWYVVHRREKRLPAVAKAFKDFLRSDGAAIIEAVTGVGAPVRRRPAASR